MSAPSTRVGRDACEEQLTSLAVMEVQESSLEREGDTSVEELALLAMMEVGGSSLEGHRETLEEDPTSLAVMDVQELSLPSGVSELSLCEEEEEDEGKPKPSTPEHPGALLPALKETGRLYHCCGVPPSVCPRPPPCLPHTAVPSAPGKGGDTVSSVSRRSLPPEGRLPSCFTPGDFPMPSPSGSPKPCPLSLSPVPPQWPHVSRYLFRFSRITLN